MRELRALEEQYPELRTHPTRRPRPCTGRYPRCSPRSSTWSGLLSLDNVFTLEDLGGWADRVTKLGGAGPYLCELKIDGLAIDPRLLRRRAGQGGHPGRRAYR